MRIPPSVIREAEELAVKAGISLEEAIARMRSGNKSTALVPAGPSPDKVIPMGPAGSESRFVEGDSSRAYYYRPVEEKGFEKARRPESPSLSDRVRSFDEEKVIDVTPEGAGDVPPQLMLPALRGQDKAGKKLGTGQKAAIGAALAGTAGGIAALSGGPDEKQDKKEIASESESNATVVSEKKEFAPTQSVSETEVKSLATQLASTPQESLKTLREYEKLAKDPRYAAGVPPTTRQELRDAIAEARALYKEEANRNDWLDVAQTLAGAIAQFGAAQQAGDKYISRVGPTPNTDWAARTNRARQDYLESVRQLESEATEERANWEAAERAKGIAYGREADALKTKAEIQARRESDELRAIRDQQDRARREAKDKEIDTLRERKFEDARLAAEEAELKSKEIAAATLTTMINQENSVSKDTRKAYEKEYPALLGKLGKDGKFLEEIRKNTKGSWGETAEKKAQREAKIAASLNENLLGPINARRQEIRQQRAALRGYEPQAPGQTPAAPVQSASKDPAIQKYADQYKLDYEQAKKVLVGRGYQPKE